MFTLRSYQFVSFRKVSTALLNSPGFSMCGACPVFGIIVSRPFGSLLHMSFAMVLNLRSYPPTMQSTGILMFGSNLCTGG